MVVQLADALILGCAVNNNVHFQPAVFDVRWKA